MSFNEAEPSPFQVVDILWSDPVTQQGCRVNEERGAGCYFGPDVTEMFLRKHNLQFIIRSHECKLDGYELCHDRKVANHRSDQVWDRGGAGAGRICILLVKHCLE